MRIATPRRNTAIEPIAMPAVAPDDKSDEERDDLTDGNGVIIAGAVVEADVLDVEELLVVVDVGIKELVDVPFTVPSGPRSTYASQSGLGTASGQVLA